MESLKSIESQSSTDSGRAVEHPVPLENERSSYNLLLSKTQSLVDAVRDDNRITAQEEPEICTVADSYIDPQAFIPKDESKEEFEDNGEYHKDDQLDPPPDGGYGWVCAACVCFGNACSWGANAAFAIFLAYYLEHDYYKGGTDVLYALMGGLSLFFSLVLSPFVMILCKRVGLRPVMIAGMLIACSCSIFGSFSKTFAQFFITQSFLLGVGYSLIASPLLLVLPTWFLHKRAFAQGLGTAGAGVGGILFSNSSNALIQLTGDPKWALRMVGLVSLVVCTVVIALLRPRRSIKVQGGSWKEDIQAVFDFSVWFKPSVLLICAWFFFYMFAYMIYLYSLSAYARSIGLSSHQGSVVNTVLSLAQLIGRPGMGLIMDRFGRVNLTILFTFIIALFSFVFWTFVTTYAQLVALAFCSGLILGVNWVSYSTFTADVAGPQGFASALTAVSVLGGTPTAVGEIIGLKLRDYSLDKPFLYCQIFTGLAAFVGGLCLFPLREIKINKMLTARRKIAIAHGDNETRLKRYNLLLQPGIKAYFMRMLYPIRA